MVQVERPTSARPGDSAIVHPDGRIDGFVGGVCAESTVRMYSLQAMTTGEPLLLRIVPEEDQMSPDGEGMVTVHNSCLSGGALQIFLQPHLPPARVSIFGASPVARALAQLSRQVGYEVSESEEAVDELPAETSAVVVASLGRFDEQALLRAIAAGVPYIALVASPKRGSAVLSSLELRPDDLGRIHTPAGLDIGARTPHEIAVSILAQIISLRVESRRDPSSGAVTDRPNGVEATEAGRLTGVETAIDPVCGMTVAAVDATLHLEAEGAVVWFCSEGCMRSFEEDPARRGRAGGSDRSRRGGVRERTST